ncbi:MAG: hypothetical protein H7Z41_16005 [Cytophagales bacterium]|nr:hypothetical protein [Armatimonadota bacterium]
MRLRRCLIAAASVFVGSFVGTGSVSAQPPIPPQRTPIVRTTPIGFPQDAGPHDASVIEWWYFNSFFTTESGKRYSVVGSFFRSGLTPTRKGHYLIYSLTDLESKTHQAYSVMDKGSITLLKAYTSLAALQNPNDTKAMAFLAQLQKNELPKPHRVLPVAAVMTAKPLFSLAMGENRVAQVTPDGRTWKATLKGDDFTINLTLAQPTRPAMLVGGKGKTGITKPDDMYYLTLSRMETTGTLARGGGAPEKITGTGWLDRQWGQSWGVNPNVGWDWFGLRLDDGSEVIAYRLRDTKTGVSLRETATLLASDGTQSVGEATIHSYGDTFTDPVSNIAYPSVFTIHLGQPHHLILNVLPVFPNQTIPTLAGGSSAIWEGVVKIVGTRRTGPDTRLYINGEGYMELVGYKPAVPAPKAAATGK